MASLVQKHGRGAAGRFEERLKERNGGLKKARIESPQCRGIECVTLTKHDHYIVGLESLWGHLNNAVCGHRCKVCSSDPSETLGLSATALP